MDSIREFMVSSSGLSPARRGIALGWVISALAGLSVLLGAKKAEACERCTEIILWEDCWNDTDRCPDPDYPRFCHGEILDKNCTIESFNYCTN